MRVADQKLGVADLAVRASQPKQLDRVESLLVELDSLVGPVHDEIRRQYVVTVRNWLHCARHGIPLDQEERVRLTRTGVGGSEFLGVTTSAELRD